MEKPKKEASGTTIKDIRNLSRLEKENKAFKDIILWDIRNLSGNEEEENYYKPVRVSNFWSNSYIEYKSNSDRNKTLLVEEYLHKIRPYWKDITNNLKKSHIENWTNNSNFFHRYTEERVMHSKKDNIEIMINDEADEIIKELFDSVKNRYQNNLE